jgi:prophage regulatory protein
MKPSDRIVREKERKELTGRSSASWWRDEQAGIAPKRIQIGQNAVGWRLSELMAWLESLKPTQNNNNRFGRKAAFVKED